MNKHDLHDKINEHQLHDWIDHVSYERTYDSVAFFYKYGPNGSGARTVAYPTSREEMASSLEYYFCEPGDVPDSDIVDGVWDLLKDYRPQPWDGQPTPSLPAWADEESRVAWAMRFGGSLLTASGT